MKKLIYTAALCALSTLPSALAEPAVNRDVNAKEMAMPAEMEKTFIQTAGKEGMGEVKLAKMATTMGSTDAIKDLGTMLMTDHSKVNAELMTIAKSKGVEIPPPDEKDMKMMDEISQMKGTDFDMAFLKAMSKCHKKDIALFEMAQKECKDPELKAFIDKTLPTLKAHATKVEMAGKMNMRKGSDKGEKSGK